MYCKCFFNFYTWPDIFIHVETNLEEYFHHFSKELKYWYTQLIYIDFDLYFFLLIAPTTKPSDDCVFLFKYGGKIYYKCTKKDHNQLWCSKDAFYKERWKNCQGVFEISLFMLLLHLVYILTIFCLDKFSNRLYFSTDRILCHCLWVQFDQYDMIFLVIYQTNTSSVSMQRYPCLKIFKVLKRPLLNKMQI